MWDLLHLVALEFAEDQGPQKGSVLRHYLYIYRFLDMATLGMLKK
jgi:hypothetical protein